MASVLEKNTKSDGASWRHNLTECVKRIKTLTGKWEKMLMTTNNYETDQEEKVSGQGLVYLILADLFDTIVDTDDRNQRPRTRIGSPHSDNLQFDYGFAVGIDLQSAEPERGNTSETLSASASPDHAATIHSIDEEYVITLDLPADDPTELSAGVDLDACDWTQWRDRIARSSFSQRPQSWNMLSNNNVLDGHLYRREDK